jgi:hypothetical protein
MQLTSGTAFGSSRNTTAPFSPAIGLGSSRYASPEPSVPSSRAATPSSLSPLSTNSAPLNAPTEPRSMRREEKRREKEMRGTPSVSPSTSLGGFNNQPHSPASPGLALPGPWRLHPRKNPYMSTGHTGYKHDGNRGTVDVKCSACGKRIALGFVKNDESPARMVLNWDQHIKDDGCDPQANHREPELEDDVRRRTTPVSPSTSSVSFNNQPPNPAVPGLGPRRPWATGSYKGAEYWPKSRTY